MKYRVYVQAPNGDHTRGRNFKYARPAMARACMLRTKVPCGFAVVLAYNKSTLHAMHGLKNN